MNICIISSLLLLFELTEISTHSISKLQITDPSHVLYQVQEDKKTNTISFVNPKPDKPTLREIIYYHVIEKPYDENQKNSKEIPSAPEISGVSTNQGHEISSGSDDKGSQETILSDDGDEDGEYLFYFDDESLEESSKENDPELDILNKQEVHEDNEPLTDGEIIQAELKRKQLFNELREKYKQPKGMLAFQTFKMATETYQSEDPSLVVKEQPQAKPLEGSENVINEAQPESEPVDGSEDVVNEEQLLPEEEPFKNINNEEQPQLEPVEGSEDFINYEQPQLEPVEGSEDLINDEQPQLEPVERSEDFVNYEQSRLEPGEGSEDLNDYESSLPEERPSENANYWEQPQSEPVEEGDDIVDEKQSETSPAEDGAEGVVYGGIGELRWRRKRSLFINSAPEASKLTPLYIIPAEITVGEKPRTSTQRYGWVYDLLPAYILNWFKPKNPIIPENEDQGKYDENNNKEGEYIPEPVNESEGQYVPELSEGADNGSYKPDDANSEGTGDNEKISDNENDKKVKREAETDKKTYGMRLNNDHGFVWNDLVDPPISFFVGENADAKNEDLMRKKGLSENLRSKASPEELKPEQNIEDKTDELQNQNTSLPHGDETIGNHDLPSDESKPNENIVEKLLEQQDLNNPKALISNQSGEKSENDKLNIGEQVVDEPAKEEINKDINESNGDVIAQAIDQISKEDAAAVSSENIDKVQLPETIKELFDNEELIKWLEDWVSTYIEKQEEHIAAVVREEVEKQIKPYRDLLKAEPKNLQEENDKSEDKSDSANPGIDVRLWKGKEDKEKTTIKEEVQTVFGNAIGNEKVTNVYLFYSNASDANGIFSFGSENDIKIDEDVNDADVSAQRVKRDDQLNEPKESSNNFKLVINGEEIPVTHSSNFDLSAIGDLDVSNDIQESGLRKIKDKYQNQDSVKLDTHNVFGNAVGNGEVKNVYVFYADATNTNGIFSFGSNNKITIDEKSHEGSQVSNEAEVPNLKPESNLDQIDANEPKIDLEIQSNNPAVEKDPELLPVSNDNVEKSDNRDQNIQSVSDPEESAIASPDLIENNAEDIENEQEKIKIEEKKSDEDGNKLNESDFKKQEQSAPKSVSTSEGLEAEKNDKSNTLENKSETKIENLDEQTEKSKDEQALNEQKELPDDESKLGQQEIKKELSELKPEESNVDELNDRPENNQEKLNEDKKPKEESKKEEEINPSEETLENKSETKIENLDEQTEKSKDEQALNEQKELPDDESKLGQQEIKRELSELKPEESNVDELNDRPENNQEKLNEDTKPKEESKKEEEINPSEETLENKSETKIENLDEQTEKSKDEQALNEQKELPDDESKLGQQEIKKELSELKPEESNVDELNDKPENNQEKLNEDKKPKEESKKEEEINPSEETLENKSETKIENLDEQTEKSKDEQALNEQKELPDDESKLGQQEIKKELSELKPEESNVDELNDKPENNQEKLNEDKKPKEESKKEEEINPSEETLENKSETKIENLDEQTEKSKDEQALNEQKELPDDESKLGQQEIKKELSELKPEESNVDELNDKPENNQEKLNEDKKPKEESKKEEEINPSEETLENKSETKIENLDEQTEKSKDEQALNEQKELPDDESKLGQQEIKKELSELKPEESNVDELNDKPENNQEKLNEDKKPKEESKKEEEINPSEESVEKIKEDSMADLNAKPEIEHKNEGEEKKSENEKESSDNGVTESKSIENAELVTNKEQTKSDVDNAEEKQIDVLEPAIEDKKDK